MIDPIIAIGCFMAGVIKAYIAIVVIYLLWYIAHEVKRMRERKAWKKNGGDPDA